MQSIPAPPIDLSVSRYAQRCRRHALRTLHAAALAFVAGASQAQAPATYSLQVKPSICVSYDADAPCSMSMQVAWQASVPGDFCLLQVQREEPLACWDHARAGNTEVQYADTSDVQYQLVDAKSRAVLAEADVVVINRDLRASRKRRRHVWSIL